MLEALKKGKYSDLDALWMQVIEDPPSGTLFYKKFCERLARKKKEEKLIELTALASMQWIETDRHKDAFKLLQRAVLCSKNPKDLLEPLLACVREIYAKRPNLERFIKASGLSFDTEIRKGFLRLRTLLSCDEGRVFEHATRGAGVVETINEHDATVEIKFNDDKPAKFSFEGVRKYLKPVSLNHFLARKIKRPEKLKEYAQKKPVDFLKDVLKDFGGSLRQSDLKTILTDRFFETREWNSWWTRNRNRFKMEPFIDFKGAGNAAMSLRDTPRSFYDECAEAFEQAKTLQKRYDALKQLAKVKGADPIPDEQAARLAQAYAKAIQPAGTSTPGARLEGACLGVQLQALLENPLESCPDPKELLREMDDPGRAISDVSVFDYQTQALQDLCEVNEEWADIYGEILIDAPSRLAQGLLKMLFEKGQNAAATEAIETLFAKPSLNPDVFVWVCKQVLEMKWGTSMLDVPPVYLLVCLMDFLEEIETEIAADDNASELRAVASKARALLIVDGHGHICRIIREVTTEEARHFLASVKAHKTLNDTYKLSIEAALRNIRSDFEDALASAAASGAHFVTAEALQRTQEEYMHLKSVEIPANSKAIGEAAALGDLSENADYDAAKEHQKVLFARVEELHDLLTRARPFDGEAVSTDTVGPGTRIMARNLTENKDEVYTLLGIWDADLENGVLSYSSPFATQFVGKVKGEQFEVATPAGETFNYEIVSIENALAGLNSGE